MRGLDEDTGVFSSSSPLGQTTVLGNSSVTLRIFVFFLIFCESLIYLIMYRAAKAKVQRLEKEVREMHRIIDDLRQSKAKGEELTKANKKLNDQVHQDRKEIIKLNGVRTHLFDNTAPPTPIHTYIATYRSCHLIMFSALVWLVASIAE